MNRIASFILGGAIGAIGALFLAPRSGEETRTMVADQAQNIANNAQEVGNDVMNKVQGGFKQATVKGQEAVENVKDAAAKEASDFNDRNEELRAKIDAARARIAEQVKQNASQTADAIKEDVPAADAQAKEEVEAAANEVSTAASKGAEAADNVIDQAADAVEAGADQVKDAAN